jgi:hypothetical protein
MLTRPDDQALRMCAYLKVSIASGMQIMRIVGPTRAWRLRNRVLTLQLGISHKQQIQPWSGRMERSQIRSWNLVGYHQPPRVENKRGPAKTHRCLTCQTMKQVEPFQALA